MNFLKFMSEKILTILLIIFSLITVEIFFMTYPLNTFIKIYTPIIIITSYLIGLIYEYNKKKKYYDYLDKMLNQLKEKYLITEVIKKPEFIEGKILYETLEQINKSMHENVNKYKYNVKDYKEYIELWIHEIKIPLATSKMIIENNKNNATRSIEEELDKLENYIDQALYYARSNTVEKDYYIKKSNLKDLVNESIKKNKTMLIQEKVEINAHDLNNIIYTDSKWIIFILNQLIQNSVKYKNKERTLEIEIYSKENKDNTVLYIKDNGVGIKKNEINRVFEKGFTGTNGRLSNKKSTGIGLYLCKKLCNKLGISIELDSKENEYTEIKIIFPNSSYINLK
mgnify:FL=1